MRKLLLPTLLLLSLTSIAFAGTQEELDKMSDLQNRRSGINVGLSPTNFYIDGTPVFTSGLEYHGHNILVRFDGGVSKEMKGSMNVDFFSVIDLSGGAPGPHLRSRNTQDRTALEGGLGLHLSITDLELNASLDVAYNNDERIGESSTGVGVSIETWSEIRKNIDLAIKSHFSHTGARDEKVSSSEFNILVTLKAPLKKLIGESDAYIEGSVGADYYNAKISDENGNTLKEVSEYGPRIETKLSIPFSTTTRK